MTRFRNRRPNPFSSRFAGLLPLVAVTLLAGRISASELESLGSDPLGTPPAFEPVGESRLVAAAAKLREAIGPLDAWLSRSQSGTGWRAYLDWPALEQQAASAKNANVETLARLYRRFDSGAEGLELGRFAAVRRALGGYLEAVGTAKNPKAEEVYGRRIEQLAGAVAAAAAAGTPEPLEPVGPILARLEESGQAPGVVQRIRRAVGRPNLLLEVDESLLGRGVNRVVDETAPVNDVVLGTRVRGTGHTTGFITLDFLPSLDRAVVDLRLDATNHSRTRGGQGPVTVHTLGTTTINASKKVLIDEHGVTALPAEVHTDVDTQTAGIGVSAPFGKRIIRKIATRKVAEMRPQAEAISAQRAEERVRSQFEAQTATPIAQASRDYQTKFRRRLMDRGWYPEMLHLNTDEQRMYVTARKSLADQVAAFSQPPAIDSDAVLAARLHESFFNNLAEQELAGRTLTKERLESELEKAGRTIPESLESEQDQPPWSITFAKRRPVELKVGDGTVRLTVRGSGYTSGDREFDAMDVWATYRIESEAGRHRLVRDGDVQIYPPDFVPGGGKKLSVQQTSLRGILQKRFNKVFDEVIEIKPLDLPGELAAAGPLPLEQLVARKDGWLAAGWRKADPVVYESVATGVFHEEAIPGEVIIEERILSEDPVVHGGVIFESAAEGQTETGSLVLSQP
ncbi:MAG: hypothetical protein ACKO1M_06685 [Planctomycetota bacterium]